MVSRTTCRSRGVTDAFTRRTVTGPADYRNFLVLDPQPAHRRTPCGSSRSARSSRNCRWVGSGPAGASPADPAMGPPSETGHKDVQPMPRATQRPREIWPALHRTGGRCATRLPAACVGPHGGDSRSGLCGAERLAVRVSPHRGDGRSGLCGAERRAVRVSSHGGDSRSGLCGAERRAVRVSPHGGRQFHDLSACGLPG